ncbi:MAG: response regulator [Pseudolabrys sp.]|nr:response regulator [Pseudolabrys sp.]
MQTERRAAIRLLKLMMAASLVLPTTLFGFGAWISYRNFEQVADERIDRLLDILHEHALKVLQIVQVTLGEVDAITHSMSDDEIRLNEGPLHERLKETVDALPQVQSVMIIDRDGHPLVSSSVTPVSRNLNFSDLDYFKVQTQRNAGLFVSAVHSPRMAGIDSDFFAVSQRRSSDDGNFNGIVSVALLPSYFDAFYARLGRGEGGYFALVRDDGSFLARIPLPKTRFAKLNDHSEFRRGVARGLASHVFTVDSQIDGVERRIGYRKLAGFPLYVMAGSERSATISEWLDYLATHLIFGIPATAFLFSGLALALRRTKRLYEEADRREAAEVAVRQAERLKALGQLTGGVAHDFNNLLMIISGNVERLRNELSDLKYLRLLDMIATATRRGETLTRQLLTYSRQQTLTPQVIDLSQRLPLIRDLLLRSLQSNANIEIKVEVPDAVCAVRVDPGEFELAILNLAVNAKDAMPRGGTLSIRARPVTLKGEASEEGLAGEFVAVRVSDTGEGISPEVLQRVFEPFFTTKEVGKGTGLGLSQVYGFAQQSGGTATITSTVGRGTAVTIYLPRSNEVPEALSQSQQITVPAVKAAGTVLLVEDNADVAEVGTGYLRQLGYRVRSVADAQAAMAALQLDPRVDLVFSDILMPGNRNGLDLARQIRERFPHIPVLLTTGYSASAQEAVRHGVVVLQKPYDLEGLRQHIAEAVKTASLRRSAAAAE